MRGLNYNIENSDFFSESLLEGAGHPEVLSSGSLNLLVSGDSYEGISFLEVLLTQPVAMLELVALIFTVIYLGRLTVFSSSFYNGDIVSTKKISSKNILSNQSSNLYGKRATFISEVGALISKPKISLLGQS